MAKYENYEDNEELYESQIIMAYYEEILRGKETGLWNPVTLWE